MLRTIVDSRLYLRLILALGVGITLNQRIRFRKTTLFFS
jgi:hypothetical protein